MILSKKLLIWILVTHFLIIIAAGHGGGPLGLVAIFFLSEMFNHQSMPVNHMLRSAAAISAAFTLLGQLLIIVTLFSKTKTYLFIKMLGIIILILGYVFILIYLWNESTIPITVITGIPFGILVLIFFYKSLKSRTHGDRHLRHTE